MEDSVWQVETTPISLAFDANSDYKLEWYGGVEEIGQWTIDYPSLFIRPDGKKKEIMQIIKMQMDTLVIQGQLQNKSTILSFYRIANDPKI
ncbi:MAG: hypothetical protein KA479_02435 [Saprospiraceae bacterium]|nr:hypothetical protein [Saprospiraceae bacterium]